MAESKTGKDSRLNSRIKDIKEDEANRADDEMRKKIEQLLASIASDAKGKNDFWKELLPIAKSKKVSNDHKKFLTAMLAITANYNALSALVKKHNQKAMLDLQDQNVQKRLQDKIQKDIKEVNKAITR